jgi:hypothetical protein
VGKIHSYGLHLDDVTPHHRPADKLGVGKSPAKIITNVATRGDLASRAAAASVLTGQGAGTVRVFRQDFTLDDAIGSHACSLEALASV